MLITRWYRISGVGSSSPCNSPPGFPLCRQWWVQLSVADTMSVDSSAAGYHFGFWFWQSWNSCQNVVSTRPQVWIVSFELSAWGWLILLKISDFQRSACLHSEKLHVALSAVISNHCSPPSLQTSVPLWANAASGQVHLSTSEAISSYVRNSQVVG